MIIPLQYLNIKTKDQKEPFQFVIDDPFADGTGGGGTKITKLSQLENDTGFITKTVADLENYYDKQTVDNKLSAVPKFSIAVVTELPTENISGTTVYLVPNKQSEENLYEEWMYVEGKWEKLGTQKVDLSGYYTKTEVESLVIEVEKKIPTKNSQLENDSNFVKQSELPTSLPASDVYDWAKQPSKPSYSNNEIGLGNVANERQYSENNPPPYPVESVNGMTGKVEVEPKGTAAGRVQAHNNSADSHPDIRNVIPTKTSQLENDSNFLDDSGLQEAIDSAIEDAMESGELKGQRGPGILKVTSSLTSYTTTTNGKNPIKRMSLSTIKKEAGVSEVLVGDLISYSYYHYHIYYIDTTYAYMDTYVSIRGATGATGSAGKDGADGTSVTVSSVTESTADGGNNVVTFSDGKTVTIKNGSKGSTGAKGADGYTPQKNVDYFDGKDGKDGVDGKDGTVQIPPLFAESLEWLAENGDTSKVYILPDGFIYAYMLTEVESGPTYKNWLTYSVNQDGSDYVGDNGEDGYRKGYRYSSSSKAEKAATKYDCIGYIPVKANDTIRITNVSEITPSTDGSSYATAYFFNDSFEQIGGPIYIDNHENQITVENGVYVIPVYNNDNIKWCKLTLMGVTDNTIITVNEEITEGGGTTTGYAWTSTGHAFVPADYEDRVIDLENKTAKHTSQMEALEKAVTSGGTDASEEEAYNRIKNWKYPIHEDAPVFLLETNKPAIASNEQTTEAVYAKYDALMSANSHYITKENCGMASDGTTSIYVYHFKEPTPHYSSANWSETKPTILICSGVHPTEQSGVHSLYYAMEEITTNPKLLDLRRNVHFVVMPMINPTGFTDSTYGVRNPDGIQVHYNFEVDFKYPTDSGYVANGNRNHGGETPLSIPETQYFDALMERYKDTLAIVISCHNNDVDEQYGTGFIWCSCATHYMCNLGFRFVDKMSAAWRGKYGTAFDEGVRWANEYALAQAEAGSSLFNPTITKEQPEWDYRVGRASISGSGGTEYKQALKYGVHGINVEVCDRCMILDKSFSSKRTANVVTMGAETYINFFRIFMAVYDPKDKKDYAPNLPWVE